MDCIFGKVTLEEVVERILRENNCYNDALFQKLVQKRKDTKEECFKQLHPEIIPMLSQLKDKNIYIGLISNCFNEEAVVIRKSELFPFFDVVCLSCEEGVQKPDEEIYHRCINRMDVKPEECIYVGDGGSMELETAQALGMRTVQAAWYLKEGTKQPVGRKPEIEQAERPMDVVRILEV